MVLRRQFQPALINELIDITKNIPDGLISLNNLQGQNLLLPAKILQKFRKFGIKKNWWIANKWRFIGYKSHIPKTDTSDTLCQSHTIRYLSPLLTQPPICVSERQISPRNRYALSLPLYRAFHRMLRVLLWLGQPSGAISVRTDLIRHLAEHRIVCGTH